jgi:hypothetical protein
VKQIPGQTLPHPLASNPNTTPPSPIDKEGKIDQRHQPKHNRVSHNSIPSQPAVTFHITSYRTDLAAKYQESQMLDLL